MQAIQSQNQKWRLLYGTTTIAPRTRRLRMRRSAKCSSALTSAGFLDSRRRIAASSPDVCLSLFETLMMITAPPNSCFEFGRSVGASYGAGDVFQDRSISAVGRVEMWRGGSRLGLSVAAPFVWRCPSNLAVTPFPHPAHRTGRADLPHPALGQDFMPSPTTGHAHAQSDVRDRSARTGARVDTLRPGVA